MTIDVGGMSPERLELAMGPQRSTKRSRHLTELQVVSLRHRYADGAVTADLAEEFGITEAQITKIARGVVYKKYGGPLTRRSRGYKS